MEPSATQTGSVLYVGTDERLVRAAVTDAFSQSTRLSTVESTDAAIDRLPEPTADLVVVDARSGDWRSLVTAAADGDGPAPVLAVVEDGETAADAIAAGATDVFDRMSGDETVLARRLSTVVAAGGGRANGLDGDEDAVASTADAAAQAVEGDSETDGAVGAEFTNVLLDTIEDVFYLVGPGGEMRRWNDTLPTVTGYSDDEIAEMDGLDLFPEDHRDRIATAIETALETGFDSVQADLLAADGERMPFDVTAARVPDGNGDVQGVVGVGRDVSRREERRRELELAETVFEEAQEPIFVLDVEGESEFRIERVNPAYREATGIGAAEVEGKRPVDLLGETDSGVEERYRECVRRGEPIEYEERLEVDGTVRDWHTKLAPVEEDGEVVRLVGATRDVTERKELERELAEQASLLDHIFNQVPSALYVKDEEARFVRKRNYDHDPEEYVGKTDIEFFGDTEYARETYADDMRVIEEGERIINKEEYNPHTDDWVLTSKVPWRGEDGDIKGLIGVSRLITEKKEFERELRLRNRAMETAPLGICILDLDDGRSIRFANEGFESLTGYTADAVEGRDLDLLTGAETDADVVERIDGAVANGASTSLVALLYRCDGTPFWGRLTFAPVTDDDGAATHLIAFLQDVTNEKEHQQTIERRLDEFGDLLAQQLRPPLDSAREALESEDVDDAAVREATESLDRAESLVTDLAAVNTFSVKSREVSESLTGDGSEGP